MDRVLDWRPSKDPRNARHLVSSLDCYARGATRVSAQRAKSVYLDQGKEGACTGFGASNVLALSPKRYPGLTNEFAFNLYHEAQTLDEWPGEDYEGSSVNGAMLALKRAGKITSYRWVKTLREVRHALSYHGAVEFGTPWYEGMWEPDSDGFLHPTGDQVGGHAWALSGFKPLNGSIAYRMENSWGKDWGLDGGAWIWESDLQTLLNNGGEAASPAKVTYLPR